jgi:hypothetical protein
MAVEIARNVLTSASMYLVGPPVSPFLVMTEMVRHKATKTKMTWKTWATTLHFWIYDCGTLIVGVSSRLSRVPMLGVCAGGLAGEKKGER